MGAIGAFLLIAVICYAVYFFSRAYANNKPVYDDNHFRQANIEVIFSSGKIIIANTEYKATQITGMRTEPWHSNRHGDSRAWRVILDIDDFQKPKHQITFPSKGSANEFMQRLSIALRKAGGTSFV